MPPLQAAELAEIAQRFEKAGVVVPADRAQGTYANAHRLLSVVHWLRQPRGVEAEPSNTFSLTHAGDDQ